MGVETVARVGGDMLGVWFCKKLADEMVIGLWSEKVRGGHGCELLDRDHRTYHVHHPMREMKNLKWKTNTVAFVACYTCGQ